ncbi:MAG TPA: hypothetical protein VL651_17050 [Bacteroidia bacterium]|jgi:hypothetical protein|nr:hypothetical protein [Bacteroidia bacterium]
MKKSGLVVLFFLVSLLSCRYDHADDPKLFPPKCDSLHPSYTNCVQPLLQARCYSCHSDVVSAYGSNGFDMQNFTSLKNYLQTMHYRGDSIYGSKFEAVIEQRILVIPMPPTGKLPQGDINIMERWIDAGAPAN